MTHPDKNSKHPARAAAISNPHGFRLHLRRACHALNRIPPPAHPYFVTRSASCLKTGQGRWESGHFLKKQAVFKRLIRLAPLLLKLT
ncbi:MAG: hypothetical protein JWR69_2761 [Pedosphaera sp.]|nr:hypothetical protein [Pedosphaera sp.]